VIVHANEDPFLQHEPILPAAVEFIAEAPEMQIVEVAQEQTQDEFAQAEQDAEHDEEMMVDNDAEFEASAGAAPQKINFKLPSVNLSGIKPHLDRRVETIKGIFGTLGSQIMTWFDEVDDPMLKDDNKAFKNEPEDQQ
jgi:hypothetical protein